MFANRIPLPLTIGTDIVHLPRIQRLLTKSNGRYLAPFVKRILCTTEIDDLKQRFQGLDEKCRVHQLAETAGLVRWLAGRFAAKEAARKAAGATKISWKDVRVTVQDSGQPQIFYLLQSTKVETAEQSASLSISHDREYVVATVLAPVMS